MLGSVVTYIVVPFETVSRPADDDWTPAVLERIVAGTALVALENGQRASVDPVLMIRMLVIGYSFGIRSERRLCEEVHLNLAYRWFCRLGLEGQVPDHSTFSKNRHGRVSESDVFRHLFETVLRRCISEGLVGGEGFAVDASVVKADANRARGLPGDQPIDWEHETTMTRAVQDYLAGLEESNPTEMPPKNISLTDPEARWKFNPKDLEERKLWAEYQATLP